MWFHVGCVCHLHLNPVCLTETLCIVIKLTCCLYPLENMYNFMKHVAPKHALPETERGTVQFWGCHLEMLIWHVTTLLSWKCFMLGGSACRQYGCTSAEVWWDGKKKKKTPRYRCRRAPCVKYVHLALTFYHVALSLGVCSLMYISLDIFSMAYESLWTTFNANTNSLLMSVSDIFKPFSFWVYG